MPILSDINIKYWFILFIHTNDYYLDDKFKLIDSHR